MSSLIDIQQEQLHHPATATKMGSRRIFAAQFKLQVLDSYRNDSECKGNQRATARKYGIHRRQIQKWLQCESNLRSSVVLNAAGGKLTNTENMSNSETMSNSATAKPLNEVAIKSSYAPSETSGTMLRQLSAAASAITIAETNTLALDKTRHSVALNIHNNNNNNISISHSCSESSKYISAIQPTATSPNRTAFAVSPSSVRSHALDVAPVSFAPQQHHQYQSPMPSSGCLHGSPVIFSMPLAYHHQHQNHRYASIPQINGLRASNVYGYGPKSIVSPALFDYKYMPAAPFPVYEHAIKSGLLEPTCSPISSLNASTAFDEKSYFSELAMDLSQMHEMPRDATPLPATRSKLNFCEIKKEPEAISQRNSCNEEVVSDEEKPWDLSCVSRKRKVVDATSESDEGISLCQKGTNNVRSTETTSSPTAPKLVKLFRPYELSNDDDNSSSDENCHDNTKKCLRSDKQRDPIIWSNHPSYGGEHFGHRHSQPDEDSPERFDVKRFLPSSPETAHWLNNGSPVSGYGSGSSVFSACSDCNCIDPTCGRSSESAISETGLFVTAVSPDSRSKVDSSLIIKSDSPCSSFSQCDEGSRQSMPPLFTKYRRQILQRWSHQEDGGINEQRLLVID